MKAICHGEAMNCGRQWKLFHGLRVYCGSGMVAGARKSSEMSKFSIDMT